MVRKFDKVQYRVLFVIVLGFAVIVVVFVTFVAIVTAKESMVERFVVVTFGRIEQKIDLELGMQHHVSHELGLGKKTLRRTYYLEKQSRSYLTLME